MTKPNVYSPPTGGDAEQAAALHEMAANEESWGSVRMAGVIVLVAAVGWLCLLGVGLGLLVTGGWLRDGRVASVGAAVCLLLIAAARARRSK